jgi:NAD+ dependent glucose-6-phosphate dehydrogenase
MRIFITGASGTCGSALNSLPYEKVLFDKNKIIATPDDARFVQGDINNLDLLKQSMKGCEVVIHLAGSDYYPDFEMGDGLGSWNKYLENNIIGLKFVFDAAVDAGVEKMVFASTHRVMGMYEKINAPMIYELGHDILIDHLSPVRTDSMYAVSKSFGEDLGRLYADEGKLKCFVLRICSVRSADADHPYAYAEYGVQQNRWTRESNEYLTQVKRLKGLWQSRRDFLQLVDLCIKCDSCNYDIFYGVSNNTRKWFDIQHAKKILGYKPVDNAETFTKALI